MGNSKNKDPNVDIYFEIDRQFYYAGDWIDGNVYIVARTPLPYKALYLRFQGKQHCHWHEKHGKTDVWYTGDRTTYQNEFILAKWPMGVPMGHYTFPFRFQVPIDVPSSYIEKDDEDFTISYPLIAYLVDYEGSNKRTDYTYNVTIVQPPRMAEQNVITIHTANPKECCCCDRGTTTMSLRFRNTAVRGGDPIQIDAMIDNTRCSKDIKAVQVEFQEHLFVEDNYGNYRDWDSTKYQMKSRPVRAGGQDTIQLEMLSAVEASTAIGSIVANYYIIKTTAKVSGCICCGDNHPTNERHVFIEARTPTANEKKVMTPPPGWNPIVSPKVVYSGQNRFNYMRNPHLSVMNRYP